MLMRNNKISIIPAPKMVKITREICSIVLYFDYSRSNSVSWLLRCVSSFHRGDLGEDKISFYTYRWMRLIRIQRGSVLKRTRCYWNRQNRWLPRWWNSLELVAEFGLINIPAWHGGDAWPMEASYVLQRSPTMVAMMRESGVYVSPWGFVILEGSDGLTGGRWQGFILVE